MDLDLVDLKDIKVRNRDAVKMLFKTEITQTTKDKLSFTVSGGCHSRSNLGLGGALSGSVRRWQDVLVLSMPCTGIDAT